MKNCSFLVLILCLCSYSGYSQQSVMTFYGEEHFLLEGTLIADSLKENRYDRLPASCKDKVREPVWKLSKASAGLSIRFLTNSPSISVKWEVLNDLYMNHMAATGIKGIDLYVLHDGTWRYLNTARPTEKSSESLLIGDMQPELREYKMYLPLYDGVIHLEVGVDSGSVFRKPTPNVNKPIIFYGTSITQGGCASRPGMVHTSILSRKLNRDCINFGFSGNGKMEQPIVELIAEMDPAFYVIECVPNMQPEEVTERTLPLVKTIRSQHPETPIILVENFEYDAAILNTVLSAKIEEKNLALRAQFEQINELGIPNVYFIDTMNAVGADHEGTVDGVHFTDLGFIRYAEFLVDQFQQIGLVDKNGQIID